MKTLGVRILDKRNNVVSVELADILVEIQDGSLCYWSILYLQATGDLGEGKSIPVFEKQIHDSENGFFIDWIELKNLSKKFWDLMDITLLGCRNQNQLCRYPTEQEMYETCDYVIEMIDSSYWEVFSKDGEFIDRLSEKFNDVKHLNPDFRQKEMK